MKKINLGDYKLDQILLPLIVVVIMVSSSISFFSHAYVAPKTLKSTNLNAQMPTIPHMPQTIYWAINNNTLLLSNSTVSGTYSGSFLSNTEYISPPFNSYKSYINSVNIVSEIKPLSTALWFDGLKLGNSAKNNFQNINTIYTTNMNGMFANTTVAPSNTHGCVNLSTWTATELTSTAYMFYNMQCTMNDPSIKRFIDLSNLSTKNISSAHYMFSGASNVQTIYANTFTNSSVASSRNMFRDATQLTGAHGTSWTRVSTLTNETYAGNTSSFARLDNSVYTDQPGYFSSKTATEYSYYFISEYPGTSHEQFPFIVTPSNFKTYSKPTETSFIAFDSNFLNLSGAGKPYTYTLAEGWLEPYLCDNENTTTGACGMGITQTPFGMDWQIAQDKSANYMYLHTSPKAAQGKCYRINSGTAGTYINGDRYACYFDQVRYFHLVNHSETNYVYLMLDHNYYPDDFSIPKTLAWSSSTSATSATGISSYLTTIATQWGNPGTVSLPTFSQIKQMTDKYNVSTFTTPTTSTSFSLITSGYTVANDPKNWLYDYLKNSSLPHYSSTYANGYWTSNYNAQSNHTTKAWCVYNNGTIMEVVKTNNTYCGIRPVVKIATSKLS